MLPRIKRILYTTDLSPNSVVVFRHAVNSARKHDARIIVLHVFEALTATTHALISSYIDYQKLQELTEQKGEHYMERIRKRIEVFCEKELGGDTSLQDRIETIHICQGYPPDEILQQADEFNCDAIIMGSHGKGFIQNTFLGSTARRVLRRARRPIFIIPMPEEVEGDTFKNL